MTPDQLDQLILRSLSGEMDALEELYHEMEPLVYSLALSILRSPAAAQDATQDTFVRLCTAKAGYSPNGTGKAWILTITRNLALRACQQNRRFTDTENLPESAFSDRGKTEENNINRIALHMALACLTQEEREITLLYASGLKHHEIAMVVHRPAATVRWKYAQAIKKLGQCMDTNARKEGTSREK